MILRNRLTREPVKTAEIKVPSLVPTIVKSNIASESITETATHKISNTTFGL